LSDHELEFGFSVGFDPPWQRQVEKAKLAEANGFTYGWVWDTHILMQECYPLLTLMAEHTRALKLGTCVTHVGPRDPGVTASVFSTLQNISGGRMICGIGRGDSAVRIRKARPARLADLESAVEIIGGLSTGDEIDVDGVGVQLRWATGGRVPVYVAAYGPKALRLAGRVGDGVIIQIADPYFVGWAMERVREGAEEVGRDLTGFQVQCAAPGFISADRSQAREEVRWFGALVGNHVADLLRHHDPAGLPADLIAYVENRTHYDYREHTRAGTDHAAYVPDEIVDRFTVIGTADACVAKLEELAAAGVTEFNLYTAVSDPEALIEAYGRDIIPRVGRASARTIRTAIPTTDRRQDQP
jgi:probable F420-dependent oxidoreductase